MQEFSGKIKGLRFYHQKDSLKVYLHISSDAFFECNRKMTQTGNNIFCDSFLKYDVGFIYFQQAYPAGALPKSEWFEMNRCCADGNVCGAAGCIPIKNGTEFEPESSDKNKDGFKRNTLTDLLKIFHDREGPDPTWDIIGEKRGAFHVAFPKKD